MELLECFVALGFLFLFPLRSLLYLGSQSLQVLFKRQKMLEYELLCEMEAFVTSRDELFARNLVELFDIFRAIQISRVGGREADGLVKIGFGLRVRLDHGRNIRRESPNR
jgi:hypothetical protein